MTATSMIEDKKGERRYVSGHVHVADVQANGLDLALRLTSRAERPWPEHPAVEVLARNPAPPPSVM